MCMCVYIYIYVCDTVTVIVSDAHHFNLINNAGIRCERLHVIGGRWKTSVQVYLRCSSTFLSVGLHVRLFVYINFTNENHYSYYHYKSSSGRFIELLFGLFGLFVIAHCVFFSCVTVSMWDYAYRCPIVEF